MPASNSQLFRPIKLGDLTLSNRVVLAPLTRLRVDANHTPHVPLVKEYYSQRGSEPGTLLISEATIVDAVHEQGSYIYMQLWALGRTAKPEQLQSEDPSYPYISASDIQLSERDKAPRPLTVGEIKDYAQYFAGAANIAIHKAGFDGVELHGATGYLIEQFLRESTNRRTDTYGGSPENRARFALEMVDAVVRAVGPRKTGLRLSPWSTFHEMEDRDPIPTYSYLVKELRKAHPTLAYIHLVDPRVDGVTDVDPGDRSNDFIREIWNKGPGGNEAEDGRRFISAGNFNLRSATELADTKGDLIAFGRLFISNPDLPYRLRYDIPLTPYDRSTFYLQGSLEPRGYTDYPFAQRQRSKNTRL